MSDDAQHTYYASAAPCGCTFDLNDPAHPAITICGIARARWKAVEDGVISTQASYNKHLSAARETAERLANQ